MAERGTLVHYDPYAYEIHEDPFSTYAQLRAEAPLYHNEALGFHALSRHADVLEALKDTSQFSNAYGVTLDPAAHRADAHLVMSFLALDPPRHTKMRALVSRGFTPRRVAELEPRIRAMAVGRLELMAEAPHSELVADLAGRLPMDVICELLGVPAEDRDTLRGWADLLVHREEGVLDVPPAGREAFAKIWKYFGELIADREKHPGGDLVSALLVAELDGDRLDPREIAAFCNLMIVAGNETTTKLLANALYWLWRFPGQRKLVADDPGLIPRWIEETLRFDSSTQVTGRVTTRDVTLHGGTIPSGARVLLLLGSANRDETVFESPDAYEVRRNTQAMLSFGHGTHFCLGASLARLEARVVLDEFWRRFPGYEVDPEGIERVHSVNVRGFARLPLELHGA